MARVVGFRWKDKPALPPAGEGEYLPLTPPPHPSAPPESYTGREDESLAQVEGYLMAPMRVGGKRRELESRPWLLCLPPRYTSGPECPIRLQETCWVNGHYCEGMWLYIYLFTVLHGKLGNSTYPGEYICGPIYAYLGELQRFPGHGVQTDILWEKWQIS